MSVCFRVFIFLLLVTFFTTEGTSYGGRNPSVVRIGTVADGPSALMPELRSLITREIQDLTRGEYEVRFPPALQLQGNWSSKDIRQGIDHLLSDRQVDLVIALGVIASNEVSHRRTLSKPVIAPFIIDADLQGLPRTKDSSGRHHLNYLASFKSFERNIEAFKEMIPFTRLTVLVDRVLLEAFPLLREKADRIERTHHLSLTFVPVDTMIQPALVALPKGTEAVYVSPLVRLGAGELKRLAHGLIAKRLPSFSGLGRAEVEQGIMATLAPNLDTLRLARTIALHTQRILSGTDAGKLPVTFSQGEQLAINMATVRAIDIWPTYGVLAEAELLHEEREDVARKLSLYTVMHEAVSVNLDLASADRKVAAGVGQVAQSRSKLLPQVTVGSSGVLTGQGPNTFGTGADPRQTAVAIGSVTQSLYSDQAWSNYTVEKQSQVSREEERRQLQLDIAKEAATSYLSLLKAKTVLRIQRDNLGLTRSNLELARVRESIGYAARDEVYRWQSEVANGRKSVLEAQAQLRQAAVSLNRLLHRPLEEPFQAIEAGLDDPFVLGNRYDLFSFIDNPKSFRVFRDFQVQEGIKSSPELHQLDAQITGQERRVLSAQRAYWMPEITMQGAGIQQYAQGGGGTGGLTIPAGSTGLALTQNQSFYVLSLGLSFPLYQGGGKDAKLLETNERWRELRLTREATLGRVEERIRSALLGTTASFPSISLSRDSAKAAEKTLDLVRDQYGRGAVDIIRLLNSQNAALTANETSANAVYNFLIDLMSIQRAIGQFDVFIDPDQRDAWFERLQASFQRSGLRVTGGSKQEPNAGDR